MEEAVAAQRVVTASRSRRPRPTARRVWYPGYTEVRSSEGDTGSLSLWLDGQAEQGLAMAMAAAVALPEGVPAQAVTPPP